MTCPMSQTNSAAPAMAERDPVEAAHEAGEATSKRLAQAKYKHMDREDVTAAIVQDEILAYAAALAAPDAVTPAPAGDGMRWLINEMADAAFAVSATAPSEAQMNRLHKAAEALLDFRDATRTPAGAAGDPVGGGIRPEAVAQAMDEDGGWWKPCSGCHETNEGHETGHHPYSVLFRCHVGAGCTDCGGIGVQWEYYTDQQFKEMAADANRPASQAPAASPDQSIREIVAMYDAALAPAAQAQPAGREGPADQTMVAARERVENGSHAAFLRETCERLEGERDDRAGAAALNLAGLKHWRKRAEAADAILAARPVADGGADWRPIAEAPDNGTPVLLGWETGGWEADKGHCEDGVWGRLTRAFVFEPFPHQPTIFQPLPPTPATAPAAQSMGGSEA